MQDDRHTLTIHHIGARGETQAFPRIEAFETDIVNVLYEADAECIEELKSINLGRKANVLIVPRCISGKTESREFFHSKHGYCSSLLPGSPAFSNLYVSANWLDYDYIIQEAVSPREVTRFDTATLDDLLASDHIPFPDFLSLDTQGTELEILRGSPKALSTSLGLVTEVEYLPLYKDQPLFGEVTDFLQKAGFILCKQYPPLYGSPFRAPLGLRGEQIPVTADFLYLRHPETLLALHLDEHSKRLSLKKLAFIAVVFGFFEHALWALEVARTISPGPAAGVPATNWLQFIAEFEDLSLKFPRLYPDGFSRRNEKNSPEANKQRFLRVAALNLDQIREGLSAFAALFNRHGMQEWADTLQEKFEGDARTLGIPIPGPVWGTSPQPPLGTPDVAPPNVAPPDVTPVDPSRYGAVWSAPADTLANLFAACSNPSEALRQALGKGYFSQYTSFRKRDYIEAVTDWQLELLSPLFGPGLERLPDSLEELASVPDHLLVERHGRTLSPDLLRNLWYAEFLCSGDTPRLPPSARNLLEIGSGYGSLARCLKTLRPGATLWLIDLPESLACAAVYLEQAFPGRSIVHLDTAEKTPPPDGVADFVLVPVGRAEELAGRHFDLALNIWSFGEMPNGWIRKWFDLIQVACQVDRIYLINAFMAPVTAEAPESCLQGDWLMQLDESWLVSHFEINPPIHRCPYIRNFYTGLSIYGTRMENREAREDHRRTAAREAEKVHLEDWAQFVVAGDLKDLGRPEADLEDAASQLECNSAAYRNWQTRTLLAITEYIGLPRMESGPESPLFRLWNDFRCGSNPNSGVLLAAHFAMTGKAAPGTRCAKEIVFLLGRIPDADIHSEYLPLQTPFAREIQALGNQGRIPVCSEEPCPQEPAQRLLRRAGQDEPGRLFQLAISEKATGHYAEAVGAARTLSEHRADEKAINLYLECLSLLARTGSAWQG